MKQKHRKKLLRSGALLFAAACFLFMGSCEKESFEENQAIIPLSPEVSTIKEKFRQNYKETPTTRSSSEEYKNLFQDLQPLWEKSFKEENVREEILLVPITARLKNISVNYECSEK